MNYTTGYYIISVINNLLVLNGTKLFNSYNIIDFCEFYLRKDT